MANETLQLVGRRIKAIRTAKGLTQAELAETTGYEPLTISRFERGAYGPSIEALQSIGKALDTEIVEFFGEKDATQYHLETLRHQIVDQVYQCTEPSKLIKALRLFRKI